MIIARIPRLLSRTFTSLTWEIPSDDRAVYLTFDDGPTPGITEWVMDQLAEYDAKGTFFCLGNNVKNNPGIYNEILQRGHSVGNHSYSHVKGFSMKPDRYLENIKEAGEWIESSLFRPPYGRILPSQVKLLQKDYRIIMWTVLSVDYNARISGEQVVRNVVENVGPGSIIVFHDSVKASKNLYHALPRVLEFLTVNNYKMLSIPG
jgi:peptidoglycan/xylan/chitin deacetylase (PgdA/CDA1 family)